MSGLKAANGPSKRLLTVGSVLQLARADDVVWGTGINGRDLVKKLPPSVDIRALRGPLTRNFLTSQGILAPAIYGDPALLMSTLWPRNKSFDRYAKSSVTCIPHMMENRRDIPTRLHLSPRAPLWRVVKTIAGSKLVVSSSLHGVIVAESYGVPARLVASQNEPDTKYRDYYEGTGRPGFRVAPDFLTGIRWGGEPLQEWNPQPLLDAFPMDLWS